ncbi:hypothetical protein [Bacillus sp. AFS088145]|uniref:hypothetical protein n=1 Tax=Bacillus sp. AFS088145 TaxID=2033514 RepID=UPI000BF286B2|nr:hypothetical protein [Bacillus sp. AFS088145]PFH90664.1 hypothetical protein COI44_04020 [Bacillus sp. AFS088145]
MLNQEFLIELELYVKRHLEEVKIEEIHFSQNEMYAAEPLENIEIEAFIKNKLKPTFKVLLFNFIEKKHLSDPLIYKKAGIDRKHFSKIRSIPNYLPKKNTIIALSLALELDKIETSDLLSSTGYTLSDSDLTDLVIKFFLEKNIYDIDLVNEALNHFHLNPLLK